MKKIKRFLTVFGMTVALVCLFLFVACGKNSGSDSTSGSGGGSGGTETHTCEHVCPECGKCLDETCTDPVCAEKCEGHVLVEIPIQGEVRYDFDAVKGYAKLTCGEGKEYNAASNPGGPHVVSQDGVGSWITGFTWNNEAKLTLNVYSDAECQADFVLRVRKTAEVVTLTNKISVDIGGDILESEAQVPASSEGATAEFAEVNIGRFWLEAGNNVITLTPQSSTQNFDFSAILLYSDATANLRWNEMKDITGKVFYGIDEHVVISDTYKKDKEQNIIGPHNVYEEGYEDDVEHIVTSAYTSNSAKWPIYSSRDAVASISIITCSMPMQWRFTSIYDFIINGEKQTSKAMTPYSTAQWGNYQVIELGEYELKAGLNEIEINKPKGSDPNYLMWLNIRAVIIDTDANVDWEEVTGEAHVCLHVCPVCGGCKTEDCTEEACATKCSCAHTCEDVCPICGKCITDCDQPECAEKCSCADNFLTVMDDNVIVINNTKNENEENVGTKWNGAINAQQYNRIGIAYKFTLDKDAKVALKLRASGHPSLTFTMTEVFKPTLDGTLLTSEATTHHGAEYTGYADVEIGTYDLTAGEHTLVIEYLMPWGYGTGYNFKGIVLKTDAAVATVSAEGLLHICEHVCPVCSACADPDCTDPYCELKCTHVCEHVCETCGKCKDPECEHYACLEKCVCEGHQCIHTCTICGGCLNAECDQPECATKCGCADNFLGIMDDNVIVINNTKNETEECVGTKWNGAIDAQQYNRIGIAYKFTLDKDAKVALKLRASGHPSLTFTMTEVFKPTLDGTLLTSEATTHHGAEYTGYADVEIGTYDLTAGEHTLVIEYLMPWGYGTGYNFKGIVLKTDAAVATVSAEGLLHICEHVCPVCSACADPDCTDPYCELKCTHVCEHVCETCGKCKDPECEHYACLEKCVCDGHQCVHTCTLCGGCLNAECTEEVCAVKCSCVETEFLAIDERVEVGGTGSRNKGESQVGTGSGTMTVTYTLTAASEGKARLYFNTSSDWGVTQVLTDMFPVTVNGTAVVSTNTTHGGDGWSNYQWDEVNVIDLIAGENVIVISYTPASWMNTNFHAIKLSTNVGVDWSVSADTHTCEHVCEVCGKCYDYTCFNANCLDMCVCEHICEHACEECGKCYDTTCVYKACVTNRCTHVCESVCPTCGKCQNSGCGHHACLEKCECVTNYVFNGVDERVTISDGLSRNVEGNYIDVTDLATLQKVTFKIYSESEQTVKLGFCISENPTAIWPLVDYFRVWVNVDDALCNDTDGAALRLDKNVYTAETVQGPGTNYDDILLGDIQLVAGENTITIAWTCVGNEAYKFTLRSLLINAVDPVSWVPQTYNFSVMAEEVKVEGKEKDATENCVGAAYDGSISASEYQPVVITYQFTLAQAATVSFYANITSCPVDHVFTDLFQPTLNGEAITSEVHTVIGECWTNYADLGFAEMALEAGEYTLQFTYKHTPFDGQTFNFAGIKLVSEGVITLVQA